MAVVSIKGGKPVEPEVVEPNEALIEMLTGALERAKNGSLQTFLGIGLLDTGESYHMAAYETGDAHLVLGLLEWLKLDFFHRALMEEVDE